jgi:hypothetical protein
LGCHWYAVPQNSIFELLAPDWPGTSSRNGLQTHRRKPFAADFPCVCRNPVGGLRHGKIVKIVKDAGGKKLLDRRKF